MTSAERWLDEKAAKKLLTDFDGSDVPWLQAYCHLLMAIAEFPLAHDWERAFDATFPSIFHMPNAKQPKLFEALAEARARLAEIPPDPPAPPGKPKWTKDLVYPEWSKKMQAWRNSAEYKEWARERKRLRKLREDNQTRYGRRLGFASTADLIAFLHLNHWPVIEPQRMADVLRHLEVMVSFSRENWKRILAETDNRNEWIPNPAQTGVLPGIEVDQERIDGWQKFLNEFEAILKGAKLIPHWRFDEGINLRQMFLEPRTFDIVLLIHGSAAVPYLEKGPITGQETWRQITHVFRGDFLRYFIWFN